MAQRHRRSRWRRAAGWQGARRHSAVGQAARGLGWESSDQGGGGRSDGLRRLQRGRPGRRNRSGGLVPLARPADPQPRCSWPRRRGRARRVRGGARTTSILSGSAASCSSHRWRCATISSAVLHLPLLPLPLLSVLLLLPPLLLLPAHVGSPRPSPALLATRPCPLPLLLDETAAGPPPMSTPRPVLRATVPALPFLRAAVPALPALGQGGARRAAAAAGGAEGAAAVGAVEGAAG
mmetsp:Transcript_110379/g.330116  ORF Transcript_110379/g.330116 Transcript_110379/m.330116 type:complete len:236 (-) Transcript_110379:84-791(-)